MTTARDFSAAHVAISEVSFAAPSITETCDGWKLKWNLSAVDGTEVHSTAAEAMHVVTEMARILAEGGTSTVFSIQWRPTSRVGRMVVMALQ